MGNPLRITFWGTERISSIDHQTNEIVWYKVWLQEHKGSKLIIFMSTITRPRLVCSSSWCGGNTADSLHNTRWFNRAVIAKWQRQQYNTVSSVALGHERSRQSVGCMEYSYTICTAAEPFLSARWYCGDGNTKRMSLILEKNLGDIHVQARLARPYADGAYLVESQSVVVKVSAWF